MMAPYETTSDPVLAVVSLNFPLPCTLLSVNYEMELNQKIWYSLVISTKGFQSSVKAEMQEPQQLQIQF